MSRMRGLLLQTYARLVAYRYRNYLDPLDVPSFYQKLDVDLIRRKAGASLTAAGVFLAVSIAVLVGVMSSDSFSKAISADFHHGWQSDVSASVIVFFIALIVRQERVITGATRGTRELSYFLLVGYLSICFTVLVIGPVAARFGTSILDPYFSEGVLGPGFALAGLALTAASAIFQFSAVELYDYAGSWAGGESPAGLTLHFHLAGLGSNSYLYGVSFALLGAALLLAQINFWLGCAVSGLGLLTLVVVAEVERGLWPTRAQTPTRAPSE